MERLLILAVVAALALHWASTTLQSSGDGTYSSIFSGQQHSEGNAEAVAVLVEKRQALSTDITRLEATLKELSSLSERPLLPTPPPPPSFRGTATSVATPAVQPPLPGGVFVPGVPPPATVLSPPAAVVAPPAPVPVPQQPPAVPVAPPQPVLQLTPASFTTQLAPATPPPGGTAVVSTAAVHRTAGGAIFYFDDEQPPPNLRDFPCPLRELKKAQVTLTCELACRDPSCQRVKDLCDGYVECTHIHIKAPAGSNLGRATAVLKHDTTTNTDDSLQRLQVSRWWNTASMTTAPQRRIYIVASYGGCGSKMMAGWLWSLPDSVKQHVYHFHDRSPPQQLHELPKPPPPVYGKKTGNADFRTGRFPGGSRFKTDTPRVSDADIDRYRVIYIYKDPVEAMVSRFGWGHCQHIQGDCGAGEAQWPRLDQYAKGGRDRMKLNDHFNAYVHPTAQRNYPVVAVNYHKLWDNLPAFMMALGLPPEFVNKFPPRTETVRNDLTGAAERNAAHTETTRSGLRVMYRDVLDEISSNPAVIVV